MFTRNARLFGGDDLNAALEDEDPARGYERVIGGFHRKDREESSAAHSAGHQKLPIAAALWYVCDEETRRRAPMLLPG